jgi:hypothetical protein
VRAPDPGTARFEIVACGVDDVTIGFDMAGSRSIGRLNEMSGLMSRRGKMLGDRASWGAFAHLLGRSVSFWRQETHRLYVQAKLGEEGRLCPLSRLREAVTGLLQRMAIVGLVSYEPPWVTRLDVAVDGRCSPADGKLLLDALEACRLPNGWRTHSVGVPRSTVYFRARASEDVKARAYCRNLKTRTGEAFGLIRLEAEQRYEPTEVELDEVIRSPFPSLMWLSRYGSLGGEITRLGREVQTAVLAERVSAGGLTYAQGERLGTYLELERLGLLESYYPPSVLGSRRREARAKGLAANENGSEPLSVDVGDLIGPYRHALEAELEESAVLSADAGEGPAALAAGSPAVAGQGEAPESLRFPGL